ncbi:MAG: cytochrome c oxidase assembly factor Coa1 family protein [Miltoncostaeaceae bacterium]
MQSWSRRIALGGAVLFGLFAIAWIVVNRSGGSRDDLNLVAGVLVYAFLAFVAVVTFLAWRGRGDSPRGGVEGYLQHHPRVIESVGEPVEVRMPPGATGRGHGQANVVAEVAGPRGEARAELALARLGREWEVLSGTLLAEGRRVELESSGSGESEPA